MLVLSRRIDQEILFPHLGITLSILQVHGRIVKIGIVAPPNIKVVRPEAESRRRQGSVGQLSVADDDRDLEHRRRNQLNLLQLRLDALQSRIDRGEIVEAEALLQGFFKDRDLSSDPMFARRTDQSDAAPSKNIRLLVVEDCDNERGLMAQALTSQGFVVYVARDGNEAFQQMLLLGSAPDFVLMDIQMPLADGRETLRRLRCDQRFSHLKVFAVTGARRQVESELAEDGWDGWFQKPVDVASLVTRIRDDFAHHRSFASCAKI